MDKQIKISVIIPAYNEINTIAEIIKKVKSVNLNKEIIIVDDFSIDGTRQYLQDLNDSEVKVFLHEKNQGKGAALRTGFSQATADIVIVQDADLEYDPNDYHRLIKPIIDGRADVVYGSRFMGEYRRVLLFWHTVINKVITFFSNMFTNLNLTDVETGYKVFASYVIKNISLSSNRFGFDPEITAKIAKMRYRIYEVPISYYGRDYIEGKKIGWKDAFAVLFSIIKYFFFFDSTNKDAGYRVLYKLEKLRKYNRWIYERIKPFLGKRILEVGSGIGNMTIFLLKGELIVATDINEKYLIYLRNSLPEWDRVRIRYLDLNNVNPSEWRGYKIDTVVCLNVLEHVNNDDDALKKLFEVIESGGRLILFVPAMRCLYGSLDKALGHYRRYNKGEITSKLASAGFTIEEVSYFNSIGVSGWFINSKLLRRSRFSSIQMMFFDFFVPIFKLEKFFKVPFGQSIVAIGKK